MATTIVRRTRTPEIPHIGCFGHFQSEDRICRNHCAVRIRCAIERDQQIYREVWAEMEAGEDQPLRFQ